LRVADAQEAAQRFARYTGLLAQPGDGVWRISTARGYLLFLDRETLHRRLDIVAPSLPWIAGTVLKSEDIAATGDTLRRSGVSVHVIGSRRLLVKLPAALGGVIVFEPLDAGVLSFD